VGALVIMNPASPLLVNCLTEFASIGNYALAANVGFLWCDLKFDFTSWVSLPAPDGTFNICIKDTIQCLGLIYNKEEAAFQITLNKTTGGFMQRWKLDGEKLINNYWAPLNLCVENKGGFLGVFLKPCKPADARQKFIFV